MPHTVAYVTGFPARIVAHPTPARTQKAAPQAARLFSNLSFKGTYKITGSLKIDDTPDDVPVHRRVVLFVEPVFRAVDSTWSDPVTGAYEFLALDGSYRYTVMGIDYEHNYRAVVADNITPDPM